MGSSISWLARKNCNDRAGVPGWLPMKAAPRTILLPADLRTSSLTLEMSIALVVVAWIRPSTVGDAGLMMPCQDSVEKTLGPEVGVYEPRTELVPEGITPLES